MTMTNSTHTATIHQFRLPGFQPATAHKPTPKLATCCSVHVGQQVVYMGSIHGGPRHGSSGVVTEALRRKAVVDMGKSGVWNIPYQFLTVPQAA